MLVPAPGRLSMTNGWPSCSPRCCTITREMMSVVPPGAKPMIQRTGRAG
jgi:hypothetical protein